MQINKADLCDNLIMDFNYHDSKILKVTKNKWDITILLKDGFVDGQINELNFITCNIKHKYDLENRIIYQLDDLVHFEGSGWHMSFLVWTKDNLLEKIEIEAGNIISKEYQIKENVLESIESIYSLEEMSEKVTKQFGKLTIEELQNKDLLDFVDNMGKEREALLSDFNNYTLISEEDLNKETRN